MGLWSGRINGAYGTPKAQPVTSIATPFSTSSNLEEALITDFFGELPEEVITEAVALRVPEVKRALQAHTSLVAPLKFEVYDGETKRAEQPFWVNNSGAFGIAPYVRNVQLVKECFLYGDALIGAEVGENDLPHDMLAIPRELWQWNNDGSIQVDERIPANYRQRLIYIPTGLNGLLVDGIDSVRQARKLELARQKRLDAPPPGVNLHITDQSKDLTAKEMGKLAADYAKNRALSSVGVTPWYIDAKDLGGSEVDLFENAMNSLRIQIANHAGVPSSFIEAGREGGSGGQMTYTNDNTKASELWVFGSSAYALAISSRLSLDDVVGPNATVRAEVTHLGPAPITVVDPESSDITE